MAGQSLVLFDGVCNLCDATVAFIIRNDPVGRFRFAALGSAASQRALAPYARDAASADSIILIDETGLHDRSTAALRIAAGLRPPWSALALLSRVPRGWRDPLYRWIARHRYTWFGRRDVCRLPSAATRDRFLRDE